MNHSYTLLEQLLPLLNAYEEYTNGAAISVEEFAFYLNKQVLFNDNGTPSPPSQHADELDTRISTHFVRIARYAKHYSRLVLKEGPVGSLDDFILVARLMQTGSKKKTELISENLLEPSTGFSIIRRLIKQGVILEFEDENDKRSKRVKLTPKGEAMARELVKNMEQVATVVTADLTQAQKRELLTVLEYLDQFHQRLHGDKTIDALHKLLDAFRA